MKTTLTLLILITMTQTSLAQKNQMTDHSNKSILARGYDPKLTVEFGKHISPKIGNPEYYPTFNDASFLEQIRTEKWSIIYFAPGACRFSAAKRQIPGGIEDTSGWTLADYREYIYQYQSTETVIVESISESESLERLKEALLQASITR